LDGATIDESNLGDAGPSSFVFIDAVVVTAVVVVATTAVVVVAADVVTVAGGSASYSPLRIFWIAAFLSVGPSDASFTTLWIAARLRSSESDAGTIEEDGGGCESEPPPTVSD
jgi:hypothetical protein